MTIYVIDLLDEVRRRLDDYGGYVTSDGTVYAMWQKADIEPTLLWSNVDLCRALNWAIQQIGERNPFKDSAIWVDGDITQPSPICQIAVTADTRAYAIHDSIHTIEDVRLASTGTPLVKTTVQQLNHRYDGVDWTQLTSTLPAGFSLSWANPVGQCTNYMEDGQYKYLTLFPTPTVDDALYLEVFRGYQDKFTWDTDLAKEGPTLDDLTTAFEEVPDNYREALVAGTCARSYLKHDSDTLNTKAFELSMAEFNSLAGAPVDARTLTSRRLNANLRIDLVRYAYTGKRISRGYYEKW